MTDLIAPRVVEARDLNAEAISKSRVVVLANVRQLTDSQLRALKDFVRDGGGLLIFPGDRINVEWYNTTMTIDNGLLPLQMTSLAGALDDQVAPARIVASHYAHAALDMFNDPRNGNLADGEVKLWYQTRARPGDNNISIGPTRQRRSLLIEKKYGEGRVIQCTTPCDADWSNLPVRPFYLPLMQHLTTYLASTVFRRATWMWASRCSRFLPQGRRGKKALLIDPAGNKVDLRSWARACAASWSVQPDAAPRPLPVDGAGQHDDPFRRQHRAHGIGFGNSIGESERQKVASADEGETGEHAPGIQKLDQNRRFGREIWRPLLWLLLVRSLASCSCSNGLHGGGHDRSPLPGRLEIMGRNLPVALLLAYAAWRLYRRETRARKDFLRLPPLLRAPPPYFHCD